LAQAVAVADPARHRRSGSALGLAHAARFILPLWEHASAGAAQHHGRVPRAQRRRPAPALFGIYRWGWGFSTSQDFNGDIALIACFASSWTAAMVWRWHADPFGFLRPWNEAPALMGSAARHAPSTGTGVVTYLMG
jgi:hypothetical protein